MNLKSIRRTVRRAHRELIAKYGPCPIHRKTFRGVKEYVR